MKNQMSATISFGLVNVQIGLASAVTGTNDVKFNQLHDCGGQVATEDTVVTKSKPAVPGVVTRRTYCTKCGEEVTATIRGYKIGQDQYIPISDAEYEACQEPLSKNIRLTKFVPVSHITPLMVEKSYYALPTPIAAPSYGLLYQTLAKLKVAGIGSQALWGETGAKKEHPCVVVADQSHKGHGVLMMHNLRLHEDIVEPDFTAPIPTASAAEKKLATEIISMLKGELDPATDLVSSQRKRLQELVASKSAGKTITIAAPSEVEGPTDMFEALRQTMEELKKTKTAGKPKVKSES